MAELKTQQKLDDLRCWATDEFRAWFADHGSSYTYLNANELAAEDEADALHAVVAAYRIFVKHARSGGQVTSKTLLQKARRAGAEQLLGSDNRLAEFWIDAAKIADAHGFCDQFELMAKALGGPTTSRVFD